MLWLSEADKLKEPSAEGVCMSSHEMMQALVKSAKDSEKILTLMNLLMQ